MVAVNFFDVSSQDVCHDIKAMDAVSHVNLTACGSSALVVDSYKAFDSTNNLAPQHGSPPGTIIDHMEANLQTVARNQYVYSYHGSVHKIDRLNYTFVNQLDNSHNQFVYLHNYPQNKPGGFDSLKFSCQTGQIIILECLSHPVDVLQVCDSIWLCIYPTISESHMLHTKQQAKLAYDNYKQDCLINQRYGISYESYMNNVISSLTDAQCQVDRNVANSPDIGPTLLKNRRNGSKVVTFCGTSVSVTSDKKCHTHSHRDINYPSKVSRLYCHATY